LEGLLVDEISVKNPDISEKEVFHDLVDKKLEAFIQSIFKDVFGLLAVYLFFWKETKNCLL